jgi:hypothetical protein
MDLMSTLSVIQQTIEITKNLRNIDEKIDAATWKLRLTEIVDKLVEAKDSLVEEKERQAVLVEEIRALRGKLADRGNFEDENGLLYRLDENGLRQGAPYCNLCYSRDDKLIRLRHFDAKPGSYAHFRCDCCNTNLVTGPSLPFPPIDGRPALGAKRKW